MTYFPNANTPTKDPTTKAAAASAFARAYRGKGWRVTPGAATTVTNGKSTLYPAAIPKGDWGRFAGGETYHYSITDGVTERSARVIPQTVERNSLKAGVIRLTSLVVTGRDPPPAIVGYDEWTHTPQEALKRSVETVAGGIRDGVTYATETASAGAWALIPTPVKVAGGIALGLVAVVAVKELTR